MDTQLEFLNNDFNTGNYFLNDNNKKPHKDSLGFFVEVDGAGQFYWFDNEFDLKNALLNGWYARDTEERDGDFYDGVILLQLCIEMTEDIGSIWQEVSAKLNTEQQLLWSGNILQLLTDENDFAVDFRCDFKDFLIREQPPSSSDENDPSLLQNKISQVPPSFEVLEKLFEYLEDYCWG